MSPIDFGIFSPMRTQRDSPPATTIHPVNAAMVLLIEDVRFERMQPHAMRVMAVFGVRVGEKIGRAPGVERLPIGALSVLSKTPPLDIPM